MWRRVPLPQEFLREEHGSSGPWLADGQVYAGSVPDTGDEQLPGAPTLKIGTRADIANCTSVCQEKSHATDQGTPALGMVASCLIAPQSRDAASSDLACHEVLFIGKARDQFDAAIGNENLVFELDPFPSAPLADIALDTHDHSGFKHSVAAIGLVVHGVGDERRFPVHAHAMHHRGVALIDETLGDLPGFFRHFTERHARLHDIDVVLHLIMRHAIEHLLIAGRFAGTAAEGSGEVRVVAVAADGIGIESDKLSRANAAPTGFIEPGVGALP